MKYDVRPKASIPTDIAPAEYARQCIAAAESSRLNPFSLHQEELGLLQAHLSHAQVTTYLNIRNSILRLWTRNPLIAVRRVEAIGCAKDTRWFEVANLCYEWLVRQGYINYGCVENVDTGSPELDRKVKRKRKTIAVIGAGISGLGCARQLQGLFAQFEDRFAEMNEDVPEVVVLEGRDRIGGRVYSRELSTDQVPSDLPTGTRCTAEMGGMIITGFDRGNPLNIIVRGQLALPYRALLPDMRIYDTSGERVDRRRDDLAEKLYNDVLERVSDYKFTSVASKEVEGDKELVENGKDAANDGGKTIGALKRAAKLQNSASPNVAKADTVVPVSSDRLTGKAHLAPGIPAIYKAAFKARAMGWPLKSGVDDSRDLNLGHAVATPGATLGSVMDEAIRQFRDIVHILPLDLRLINWHIANLEYSNAIGYHQLSLGGWDVDAGNEWDGQHTMVIGGYQQVARGLLHCPQPLNVRKNFAVKRIAYGSGRSRIEAEDGQVVEADCVVSTVPLGVLKHKTIEFDPPLPDWKDGAIQRLGFGILNKVILVFKETFWETERDIFGVLQEPVHRASLNQKDYTKNRGRFFQWFNVTKTSGKPTLLALMAGDAAYEQEDNPDDEVVEEAMKVLRSVHGPSIPEPEEVIITRWGKDKFARGSYSSTSPDFRQDDYEVMAKSIDNLFFAGEHTCGTHPATVHGAYISALRAASEVVDQLIGPVVIPENLLPSREEMVNLKRKAADMSTQQPAKLSPRELYDAELWQALIAELGEAPFPPAKVSANPYILYGKDKYEDARKKCEEGRRLGKGRAAPNEVRIMLAKMWKEATDEEKQPFNERAAQQKKNYAFAQEEYKAKYKKWDEDAIAFKKKYEAAKPYEPTAEELKAAWGTPPRDRKVKRVVGYAEDSDSDIE
jgi:lysine-specific histone demethylase 1